MRVITEGGLSVITEGRETHEGTLEDKASNGQERERERKRERERQAHFTSVWPKTNVKFATSHVGFATKETQSGDWIRSTTEREREDTGLSAEVRPC